MKNQAFFENIQQVISTELLKAKKTIYVAVAWFTDTRLLKILEEKAKQGIKIKVIFVADEINDKSGVDFSDLESLGGKVFPLDVTELLMHNKFCIIDNKTVITGSYNWTNKAANSNLENVMLITGNAEVCEQYQNNFNKILSEYFDEDFSNDYHSRLKPTWQKYKFYNEEYANFGELSSAFSENLVKWKDAQEHFRQGYIQKWLEEINDFDTIIQFKKACTHSDDLECQIAYLTYFANKNSDFSFLGQKIDYENLLSILNKSKEEKLKSEESYIIEYLRTGYLARIFKMFLYADNKEENSFYKSLNFIWSSDVNKQKKDDSIIRFLEWKINSDKFIPFESIYYDDVEFLMKNEEVDEVTHKYYVVQSILDKLYSSKREDMLAAVKDLRHIQEHPKLERETFKSYLEDYILPNDFFEYINSNNISTLLSFLDSKSLQRLLPKDVNQYFDKTFFLSIKNELQHCCVEQYLEYAIQLLKPLTLIQSPELLFGLRCDNKDIKDTSLYFNQIYENWNNPVWVHQYLSGSGEWFQQKHDNFRLFFNRLYWEQNLDYCKFYINVSKRRRFTDLIYSIVEKRTEIYKSIGFTQYLNLDIIKVDTYGWLYNKRVLEVERRYNISEKYYTLYEFYSTNINPINNEKIIKDKLYFFRYFIPIEKSILRFDKLGFENDTAIENYLKGKDKYNDYLDINGNFDYITFWWDAASEKVAEQEISYKKYLKEKEEKTAFEELQKNEVLRLEQIQKQEAEEREKRSKKAALNQKIEKLKQSSVIFNDVDMIEIVVILNKLKDYHIQSEQRYNQAFTKVIVFLKDVVAIQKCSKDAQHELLNEIINSVTKHEKTWFSFGIAQKIGSSLEKIKYEDRYIELI